MKYTKLQVYLVKELGQILGFNLARTKCLSEFILSLIKVRSINLVQISRVFRSGAKVESSYKRLYRFIKEVRFDQEVLAPFLVMIMGIDKLSKWSLLIDRTNWRLGEIHVSLLHLSVYCCNQKISVPLFWIFLVGKKQGNSGFENQYLLMERFISVFGVERIDMVIGDREFISKHWLGYLQNKQIPYIMRMREQYSYVSNSRGVMVRVKNLLYDLKPGEQRHLGERRIAKSNNIASSVSGLCNSKGELVVLMHSKDIKDAPSLYRNRWQIEVMFRCFKSGGFDMEATHVTMPERMETITAVIAIAFCISYKAGLIETEDKPPPVKSHGRKAISVFRIGLDKIQYSIFNIECNYIYIISMLRKIFRNLINNYNNLKNNQKFCPVL